MQIDQATSTVSVPALSLPDSNHAAHKVPNAQSALDPPRAKATPRTASRRRIDQ
jgi:hypothetical protein